MANKIAIPKITVVTLAAKNGAAKLIAATQFDRYVEIQECPPADGSYAGTFAAQGCIYQRADDSPAYNTSYGLEPEDILAFGDKQFARDRGVGVPPTTDPAGTSRAGTPFVKMTSATATTTQVRVSEWP